MIFIGICLQGLARDHANIHGPARIRHISAPTAARLFTRGLIFEGSTSFTGGMGKIKSRPGPFTPLRVQFQLTIPKVTWQLRAYLKRTWIYIAHGYARHSFPGTGFSLSNPPSTDFHSQTPSLSPQPDSLYTSLAFSSTSQCASNGAAKTAMTSSQN